MRTYLLLIFLLSCFSSSAQDAAAMEKFWSALQKHCGLAYEGTITVGGKEGDGFTGEHLAMRMLSCDSAQIKIPFFVGKNKSRTWVLTRKEGLLELKHDHRQEDGREDAVTMYGGTTTNTGSGEMQIFPADPYTCQLLPYACGNIWWITLHATKFTYNLRRIGSDRVFSVEFDLTKPIEYLEKPWGWEE